MFGDGFHSAIHMVWIGAETVFLGVLERRNRSSLELSGPRSRADRHAFSYHTVRDVKRTYMPTSEAPGSAANVLLEEADLSAGLLNDLSPARTPPPPKAGTGKATTCVGGRCKGSRGPDTGRELVAVLVRPYGSCYRGAKSYRRLRRCSGSGLWPRCHPYGLPAGDALAYVTPLDEGGAVCSSGHPRHHSPAA